LHGAKSAFSGDVRNKVENWLNGGSSGGAPPSPNGGGNMQGYAGGGAGGVYPRGIFRDTLHGAKSAFSGDVRNKVENWLNGGSSGGAPPSPNGGGNMQGYPGGGAGGVYPRGIFRDTLHGAKSAFSGDVRNKVENWLNGGSSGGAPPSPNGGGNMQGYPGGGAGGVYPRGIIKDTWHGAEAAFGADLVNKGQSSGGGAGYTPGSPTGAGPGGGAAGGNYPRSYNYDLENLD